METTHNVNDAFGPETANEHKVQWWFKKFCKVNENLKRRTLASHWKLTMANWKDYGSWSSYNFPRSCQRKNLTLNTLWFFGIWSKFERWKSSIVDASWAEQKSKIIISLKYHLLLFYATTAKHQQTISWSDCDM